MYKINVMKTLFRHTGYRLFTQREKECQKKVSFSYILNPDGSLRWFWNTNSNKPLFLKFYNAVTTKGKLFRLAINVIFSLRLQRFFFKKENVYYTKRENPLFDIENDWAVFTGTVGPNNKDLLFANGSFYKIANTEKAKKLLKNESENSKYVDKSKFYTIPKAVLHTDSVLQLSDISDGGRRQNTFGEVHAKALQGMKDSYQGMCKISDWSYFQELRKKFENINDHRIPAGLTKKVNSVLAKINEEEKILRVFSHGDFTSWNCYTKGNILAIYDWEMASRERSKAFDFFHFIIQNGILISRKPWKEILKEIKVKNTITFNMDPQELDKYLKFYLITNILFYLNLYAEQEKWHMQIQWLLRTWSEALNFFLIETYTERELLIMDIFDELSQMNYATLKLNDEEPEKLNLNSDLDIVLPSREAEQLILYLSQHSLVKNICVVKKSFMKSVRIINHQNEILNLDLISQFKWKYLQILNTDKILKNRQKNRLGIYKVSDTDTARFIDLFYSLNSFQIPPKYESFVSKQLKMEKIKDAKAEVHVLKKQSYNRGLKFLKNLFFYIKDTFAEKGFIITFSGVDGAGKSTVISEVSELIEKRFRRPVIVLRHRPSLLPILSVYIKGNEKAKQDVLNSLPRQGQNRSAIASLLRFSYYYIDYIFGQFIIYLKYVLRGKIVLYDRYYFDFIADGRRSNIQLPKTLTEAGYHLLLKAKFNFFLYASPEEILSRKKELSYHSICSLTKEYSQLFSRLDKQNRKSKYLSIENINLNTTVSSIMNTIITAR